MTPGIYDWSAADYHADKFCPEPSLSSSIARVLLNQTPRHAWQAHPRLCPAFVPDDDEKFDIGNAAHALMLRDPRAFAIGDFPDWRTKEAKLFRVAARHDGKIPLLREQWERVSLMVGIGRVQLEGHDDAERAFTDGKPEQTLIWREGDAWMRARLDWLHDDHRERFEAARTWTFDDYKTTTTADPSAWARIAVSIGHDIQVAFYRRGIRALGLAKDPVMRFVVQETEEPYALCVMRMSDAMLELADRQVERAIAIWRKCLSTNDWPGYPPYTVTIESPHWHEERVMEREVRESAERRRHRPTQSDLKQAMEMQAP